MEINRIIKKSAQFTNDLEKAFEKDITLLIDYMIDNFDIYDKNTNEKYTKLELNDKIKRTFYKMNDAMCCAVTKSGIRCSRKSHEKTNYCKIHINNVYKYKSQNNDFDINTKITNNNSKIEVLSTLFLYENNNEESKIKNNLIKKFINDEFYYIDDKYIYNNNTYIKCGYIDKDDNKEEYIFTDDPFILDEFD